jgi:predicted ATP-dependent endonuclease of OLD family
MKLQKLIIINFRGLKGNQNVIDFSNSNIIFLIGENNVGKSSFLRAYEFFVNSSQKASETDFFNYDQSNHIEIEGVFLKEDDDDADEELQGSGKNIEPDWVNKWVDSNKLVRVKKIWVQKDKEGEKYTFSPLDKEWVKNGFGGLPTLFQKYSPTPISISAMETEITLEEKVNKLIQDEMLKKLRDDYPNEFSDLIQGVKNLQKLILGSEAVTRYNNEINENFKKVFTDLTLKINPKNDQSIKLEDAFKKNHSVNIKKEGIDREEVFTQHGHGIIRQALYNFVAFLKKSNTSTKKEYIILFEEPELFLHPEAAYRLRSNLYDLAGDSPFQILCATHSPLMIDVSKTHSSLVRVVKDLEENTKTYQAGDDVFRSDDEKKQRIQMINRFNPHICEAFYAKKIIIVEGDTEAIVFRELVSNFFPNEDLYVLNSGSKNNIPFFQEILTAFNIEHYIIHDTDERLNINGNTNSAWTLNGKIWDYVEKANQIKSGLSRRYVHMTNFEIAHNINSDGKDKPLKAYEFVKSISIDSDQPCMNYLRDIIGDKKILHDQVFIENR